MCIMGKITGLTLVCVRPQGSEPGCRSQRPGWGSGPRFPDLQHTKTRLRHIWDMTEDGDSIHVHDVCVILNT